MKTQNYQYMIHCEGIGYLFRTNNDKKKECIKDFVSDRINDNWQECKKLGYSCRKVLVSEVLK